ncbi:DUF255 domain-containing protein [Cytophagaceae bacterium ABcell3]|nr:DUF255 domain-containing protein [Cytophagaceae bacterium ABcell3]
MKLLKLLFTFSLIVTLFPSHAQKNQGLVNWITIEEAEKKAKAKPKPIMVDVYTDWCGWCKKMMNTTFSDPQVAEYINKNFYAVAFNAETKDTITWQGKTYTNKEKGPRGTHELTYHFLPEKRSYPSTVFMTGDMKNSTLVPGYLDANTISPILVYYQENLLGKANINDFMAYFDSTFSEDKKPLLQKEVKWYSIQEAFELNSKHPKKIFIHLQNKESISSQVMDSTSYTHPVIADYLNKNFYPVRFDAESKETVNILGHTLEKKGKYHQLVSVGMNNKISFPSILLFNEQNELITPIPQYLTPKFMEQVLYFFKEDVYLKNSFADFQKNFQGSIH